MFLAGFETLSHISAYSSQQNGKKQRHTIISILQMEKHVQDDQVSSIWLQSTIQGRLQCGYELHLAKLGLLHTKFEI